MAVYPVILCGGAGTRLWPASRPDRPKQFLDLVGPGSLFQQTAERVRDLAVDGRVLVVAGRAHRRHVLAQLAEISLDATVLLEPEGRDSAPAMAAAAAWVLRRAPDGILVFVASDHHIPDAHAFRQAARAAADVARSGRIVTFGVRPTEPATAYGYIRPKTAPGLSDVEAFVEKPDRSTAEAYVEAGYLWNSGNFMVSASTLRDELNRHAPGVFDAADEALGRTDRSVALLSQAFRGAPKISIDYAVMERSDRVSVLPVDFAWSDLGAWDAVARAAPSQADDDGRTSANFIRAAPGMTVATAGVSGVAVIAERDAVLVCALDEAQAVKALAEAARPIRIDTSGADLVAPVVQDFEQWMRLAALPLWASLGVDLDGGFVEGLDDEGRCPVGFRRARVQARQAYVFATAGKMGWPGPWRGLVDRGLERFDQTNRRADGLYRTQVTRDGAVIDETATLYDQAFTLLALAMACATGVAADRSTARATALAKSLDSLRHAAGGWREAGPHPYQANAHMHLLEACLAWEAIEPAAGWTEMADEVVSLARTAFIDPDAGFLREFFDARWRPADGPDGEVVEPGHQFEWAWLLARWGRLRADDWATRTAERLYAAGAAGVDHGRGVAIDQFGPDLRMFDARSVRTARLWPQTERVKAALILSESSEGPDRDLLMEDIGHAMAGLNRYLRPSGLWIDRLGEDGQVIEGPYAPASSLYHIMAALEQARCTFPRAR